METTSVTSKGQVTIPKKIRQRLGIHQGSCIEFSLVGNHVEMHVQRTFPNVPEQGYGLLKSPRKSVPADLDPARLLKR